MRVRHSSRTCPRTPQQNVAFSRTPVDLGLPHFTTTVLSTLGLEFFLQGGQQCWALWAFLAACPCALLSSILYVCSLIGRLKMLACLLVMVQMSTSAQLITEVVVLQLPALTLQVASRAPVYLATPETDLPVEVTKISSLGKLDVAYIMYRTLYPGTLAKLCH